MTAQIIMSTVPNLKPPLKQFLVYGNKLLPQPNQLRCVLFAVLSLQCLFSMVFAAATMGVLRGTGLVFRVPSVCHGGYGYSSCDFTQDLRTLMSFVLGAGACCAFLRHQQELSDPGGGRDSGSHVVHRGGGQDQLHACLL